MDEKLGEKGLTPLEWGKGKVRVELAHQGLVHQLESAGSFFRLGSDPRCEWCIPTLPDPVVAYVQVGPGYLSVVELVDSREAGPVEPICLFPGGTVWLHPNARMTLSAMAQVPAEPETFSWETFHAEDIKVFPNTLVVRSGLMGASGGTNHFRLQSSLSLLGTSPGCHVRIVHRNLSKFQAVIFRGELQGQPMRVVDLFGAAPTLIKGQPANGETIEVGQELQIGGVRFEAVRFLYHASRPDHLIQVGHSFPTLPLPPPKTTGAVPAGGAGNRSGKEVGGEKGAVQVQGYGLGGVNRSNSTPHSETGPAIGFDLPTQSKNSIHFDLHPVGERVLAPIPQISKGSVQQPVEGTSSASVPPAPPPLIPQLGPQVFQGTSKADLEEVQQKSLEALQGVQRDLSEQIKSLTKRLDGIEEAIEYFPMAMQENSDQLMQAMNRLCDTVSSLSRPVPSASSIEKLVVKDEIQRVEPLGELPPSGDIPKRVSEKKPVLAENKSVVAKEPTSAKKSVVPKEPIVAAANKPQAKGPPVDRAGQGTAGKVPAQKREPVELGSANPAISVSGPLTLAVQKAEAEEAEKKSWISKWTVWFKKARVATPQLENEEIQRPVSPPTKRKAEKDFVGESVLVNSSNTTARRSRLQSDPNSAEILASHESEDETLVLGSLMGLRYRDAKTALLRWVALFGVFFLIAVIGGPLAWYRIPEGWRELIWQKITFAPEESPESIPGEMGTQSRSKTPSNVETSREDVNQAGGESTGEVVGDSPKSFAGESEGSPEVVPESIPKLVPENQPGPDPAVEPSVVPEPSTSTKDEPAVVEPMPTPDPEPTVTPGVDPPAKP